MEPSKGQRLDAFARRLGLALVSEAMGTAVLAGIVMVLSYSGLHRFAETQGLPAPNLFPLAFDLPAVVVARTAWKAHRLGSKATPARLFAAVLVLASAALQASPTLVNVTTWAGLRTSWAPLAAEVGPPFIAYGLLELYLWLVRLQEAAAFQAAEAEKANRKARKSGARTVAVDPAPDPEAGQRRPAPSELVLPGEKGPEVATSPPPAPVGASPEEVEALAAVLAPEVDGRLGDLTPSKDRIRPHVVALRGTGSTELVLAVNRHVKALRAERAEAITG